MSTAPYPLLFEPIYKEKVWGGRALEKLGRTLPPGNIGESWELVDLASTSPSGGGGGSERSVVANGPWRGRTFHDAFTQAGRTLLGDLPLNDFGEFPLLVKFLDANENLSVQVHPSAEYAATHPGAYLKSEAWYVLDCRPGACIYKGVQPGVTREQFRRAIETDAIEALMIRVPVEPGDCHYLPSGTCHALGAGVLVAEVQTPSDTTFRVYDWGRQGRELHIEQALACINFDDPTPDAPRPTRLAGPYATIDRLVTCEYFRIDRVATPAGATEPLHHRQPLVWMVLSGEGVIEGDVEVALHPGRTVYLPPKPPHATLRAGGALTWLEVSFPQADAGTLAQGSKLADEAV